VIQLGKNQTFDAPQGVFVFAGPVECERQIYLKGSFITSQDTIKSLEKGTLLLSFTQRGRGLSHIQDRLSN